MSFCGRCAAPLAATDRAGRCQKCRIRRAASIDRRQGLLRQLDTALNYLRWPRLMLRVRRAGRR